MRLSRKVLLIEIASAGVAGGPVSATVLAVKILVGGRWPLGRHAEDQAQYALWRCGREIFAIPRISANITWDTKIVEV